MPRTTITHVDRTESAAHCKIVRVRWSQEEAICVPRRRFRRLNCFGGCVGQEAAILILYGRLHWRMDGAKRVGPGSLRSP